MSAIDKIIEARGVFGGRIRTVPLWRWALARLFLRLEVRRQRRALADLTPSQLRDIGVTPEQARRESQVSFWAPFP